MDKKELDEGMKDAKKGGDNEIEDSAADSVGAADGGDVPQEWAPDIDWVMKSVGPFFNNNAGLGELLLDKLNENGVNTEGAALAGMVNVLQQFNREYKELGKALGNNIDRIDALESQSEDLASAVEKLLKEMDVSTEDGPQMSIDDGTSAGVPPDMGAGVPPDMGTAPPGVVSDERLKESVGMSHDDIIGIVSDARMKRNAGKVVSRWLESNPQETQLSPGIIGACKGLEHG